MCMNVDGANTMLDRYLLVSRSMQHTRYIYLAHPSISMNNYVMTTTMNCSSVRILLLYINYLCLLFIPTLRRQDFFSHLWNGSNKIEISSPMPLQDSQLMNNDCRPPFWELIFLLNLEENWNVAKHRAYKGVLSPHVYCRGHGLPLRVKTGEYGK